MSYESKINSTVQLVDLENTKHILDKLGFQIVGDYSTAVVGGPYHVKAPDGTRYDLRNAESFDRTALSFNPNNNAEVLKSSFNLYDIIAAAKASGIPNENIAAALDTYAPNPDDKNKSVLSWTPEAVSAVNNTTNTTAKNIQEYISSKYPQAGMRVEVHLNKNGKGYTYYVTYPGATEPIKLEGLSDNATPAQIEAKLNDTALPTNASLNSAANTAYNAQAQYNLADSVLSKLGSMNVFANASNDLSAADRAAITAALPSTDDLQAWTQGKDANIFNTLITNLRKDNPEVLERMSLEQLQGLASVVNEEQQSVTNRNIDNQQAQLLQGIAKDPELYNKLTQQARVDNAAGTIAGQRAANAQAIAAEADANYDKQAADLYASLFNGEGGNVAQQTYANAMAGKTNALDQFIQGQIDNALEAERQGAISVQELQTMLSGLETAFGVDVAKYADAITQNQAAAGGKATSLVDKVTNSVQSQIAAGNANLGVVESVLRDGSAYLNGAGNSDGSVTNVNPAIQNLISALQTPVGGGGYKTVQAGPYQNAMQFDNKQYEDLVGNQEFMNWILSDSTIDSSTKAKSLKEFMQDSGLDMLTKEGLTSLYTQYNDEATQDANKVFNKAQRAYIAAITAGDAKTADQLTRLASTAGASKGNLYTASALSNQFKQQAGLSSSGRQLATDFLNQQSFNRSAAAQAVTDAGAAQNKYLGTGADSYDSGTLYGAYNQHLQNKADGSNAYGSLGSKIMGTTQDLNSWNVKNQVDNYNRLVEVAQKYTAANAAAGAHNATAAGTKKELTASAEALKRMAEQGLPN